MVRGNWQKHIAFRNIFKQYEIRGPIKAITILDVYGINIHNNFTRKKYLYSSNPENSVGQLVLRKNDLTYILESVLNYKIIFIPVESTSVKILIAIIILRLSKGPKFPNFLV